MEHATAAVVGNDLPPPSVLLPRGGDGVVGRLSPTTIIPQSAPPPSVGTTTPPPHSPSLLRQHVTASTLFRHLHMPLLFSSSHRDNHNRTGTGGTLFSRSAPSTPYPSSSNSSSPPPSTTSSSSSRGVGQQQQQQQQEQKHQQQHQQEPTLGTQTTKCFLLINFVF
mmetsp:Transcript_42286/g.51506  ORF Transcript_42286/g.51506 Transcript_42286/m.51506 type:complete len:166 (+) Transcript_42286:438-935(+)